jgi:hypothetical protein
VELGQQAQGGRDPAATSVMLLVMAGSAQAAMARPGRLSVVSAAAEQQPTSMKIDADVVEELGQWGTRGISGGVGSSEETTTRWQRCKVCRSWRSSALRCSMAKGETEGERNKLEVVCSNSTQQR